MRLGVDACIQLPCQQIRLGFLLFEQLQDFSIGLDFYAVAARFMNFKLRRLLRVGDSGRQLLVGEIAIDDKVAHGSFLDKGALIQRSNRDRSDRSTLTCV